MENSSSPLRRGSESPEAIPIGRSECRPYRPRCPRFSSLDARCYVGYSTAGHGDFSRSLWLLWASFEALRIPYWLNDLSVLGSVISVAQDAAGQRAAMLAVFEQHLAVDDRHMNALRRLLDSLGAGREVVQHFQR